MGRHVSSSRRSAVAILAFVGAVVLAGAAGWAAPRFLTSSEAPAKPTGAATPQGTCPSPSAVSVTAAPEIVKALQSAWGAAGDKACFDLSFTAAAPAQTVQEYAAGRGPDLWVPDSSAYLAQVPASAKLAASDPVALSPVVVAANAAGKLPAKATWPALMAERAFRLPDPKESSVGFLSALSALSAIQALPQPERTQGLGGLASMLGRLVPLDEVPGLPTSKSPVLFPASEQSLAGSDGLTVHAIPGSTPLDYRVVEAGHSEAAKALIAALTSTAGAESLRTSGFRTPADLAPVVDGAPDARSVGGPPKPAQVKDAVAMWRNLTRTTRLLAVIDVSGSMKKPVGNSSTTRIQVASQASGAAIKMLASHDSVGLWVFSTNQSGNQDWRVLTNPLTLTDKGRADLGGLIRRVPTMLGGDTGLYDTIDAAYTEMQKDFDPRANQVLVVITDGANDDPGGGLNLTQLKQRLSAAVDPKKPIIVVLIGMGEADTSALKQIVGVIPTSALGGGQVFRVEKPEDIANVYGTLVLGMGAVD